MRGSRRRTARGWLMAAYATTACVVGSVLPSNAAAGVAGITRTPAGPVRVLAPGRVVHPSHATQAPTPPAVPHPTRLRAGRTTSGHSLPAGAPTIASPGVAGDPVSFTGITYDSSYGVSSTGVNSADSTLAVSATDVVQAVDSSMRVTDKQGNQLAAVSLDSIFHNAPWVAVEPRLAYDGGSARWFLSAVSYDQSGDSTVEIAVSTTADPTGSWSMTYLDSPAGVIIDRPKLGLDDDVVALAWDDFNASSLLFNGSETWVLQKSDLVAGSALHVQGFGPDTRAASPDPAVSVDHTTTELVAVNQSCGGDTVGFCTHGTSSIDVLAYTGTPAAGNVARTSAAVGITGTNAPPSADQPGYPQTLDTSDDQFQTAGLEGGILTISANDTCQPAGDATTRPCGRVLELNAASTPSLHASIELGVNGADVSYPSAHTDPAGDTLVGATESGPSVYPSAVAFTMPAGASAVSELTLAAGTTAFRNGRCSSSAVPCPWGYETGAAVDPSSPADIWIAPEYGAVSDGTWATQVARLTFNQLAASPSTTAPTAGSAFTLTVNAETGAGAVETGYRGTVHFSSSDPLAVLPSDYSYTSLDSGSHAFSVTLDTAGMQTVTVSDAATGATEVTSVDVTSGAATHVVWALPTTAPTVEYIWPRLTVEDRFGNAATTYSGTLHFTSSDTAATLPANVPFTSGNQGTAAVLLAMRTAGYQSVSATDTTTPSITGTAYVLVVPPPITVSSAQQYSLVGNDGTWRALDANALSLQVIPDVDATAVVSANVDLWTGDAGYNQDVGIAVAPLEGSATIAGWKESGGYAGTFSPNAAAVQGTYSMLAGHVYQVWLVWRTNVPSGASGRPSPSHIFAGAGGPGAFSPTTLAVNLVPTASGSPVTASSTSQYTLSGSDGSSWRPVDASNLRLSVTPSSNIVAFLTANADLWTSVAGVNQDVGIEVSPPCANGTGSLAAWKESGGNAGTFSPNAAFVQDACAMTASTTYTVTLVWKSNRPFSGGSIAIGAGNGPYSPTTLFAQVLPAGTTESDAVVSTQQELGATAADNGTAFRAVNGSLAIPLTASSTCTAYITGNADLWTADAGYNQDLAIIITQGSGPASLLAWKESGGFAGTFSPNAAFVQGTTTLKPGSYTVMLEWRANRAMPSGDSIWMAAGSAPSFSPTSLDIQLAC